MKLQALVEELDLGVSGLVQPETASRVGKFELAEEALQELQDLGLWWGEPEAYSEPVAAEVPTPESGDTDRSDDRGGLTERENTLKGGYIDVRWHF